MRKTIETISTLALWVIWFVGSELAISEFLSSHVAHKKVMQHLGIIAWSPVISISVFAFMMLAVWLSKDPRDKKTIPSEHIIKWSKDDLINAKNGKIIDLHFSGSCLDCEVKNREEVAEVLHNEQQSESEAAAEATDSNSNKKIDDSSVGLLQEAF